MSAMRRETWCPFRCSHEVRQPGRSRIHDAIQPLPVSPDQCSRRAGLQFRQAMKALEEVFEADHAPGNGLRLHGHELPGEEGTGRRAASVIFGFSLLFVFLILAAQYESWSLPFSVLSGRRSRSSALCGHPARRHGIQSLCADRARSCSSASRQKTPSSSWSLPKMEYEKGQEPCGRRPGRSPPAAAPILMTSFAFILGCVPLALASGSGSMPGRSWASPS